MDDLSQFQDLFIETSSDHVSTLISLLDKYKVSRDTELIDDIHLHFHSLKGEAFAMKLNQFGEYITILESYIKTIKASNSFLPDDKITTIKDSLSEIVQMIENIKSEKKEPSGLEIKSQRLKEQLEIPV